MNHIENYLLYRAGLLPKHLSAGFIINMIAAMSSFAGMYSFFMIFPPNADFIVTQSPALNSHASAVSLLTEALGGITVSLALLFFSCFSIFARKIMLLLCIWRRSRG